MGKYSASSNAPMRRPGEAAPVHPIWRGIGVILFILMVIMSAIGAQIIDVWNIRARIIPLSPEVAQNIVFPAVPYTTLDFNALISWIPGYPFRWSELIFFLALLFLSFGLLSIIYAFLYNLFGPPRNPLDAPEFESRKRKKKR